MKVVTASGGIGWISRSLHFRFGHIPSFESFGRIMAFLFILSFVYASIDLAKHFRQFQMNKKTGTAMTSGSHSRRKKPSDFGLKRERPSLWYCFVTAFYEHQSPKDLSNVNTVTRIKSDLTALVLLSSTAVVTVMNLGFPVCYLPLGHQWFIQLQDFYPRSIQHSVYLCLVAALANNLVGFVVTLVKTLSSFEFTEMVVLKFRAYVWCQVVKKKVSLSKAAMIMMLATLVPVLQFAVFVAHYHREERLGNFFWSSSTCQI